MNVTLKDKNLEINEVSKNNDINSSKVETESNPTAGQKNLVKDHIDQWASIFKSKSLDDKQLSYLHQEIKIENSFEVDQKKLLTILLKRFKEKLIRWKVLSRRFQFANFLVTFIVINIQITQAIIFQMDIYPEKTRTAIATILPAVISSVLAVQLKLGWTEKSMKARQSAKLYKKLYNHVEYRLLMIDVGGQFKDVEKLWNVSLLAEVEQIPAFLNLY